MKVFALVVVAIGIVGCAKQPEAPLADSEVARIVSGVNERMGRILALVERAKARLSEGTLLDKEGDALNYLEGIRRIALEETVSSVRR